MDVEELRRPGASAAGAVLGQAFVDDPVFGWLVQGSNRERRLTQVFSAFAGTAARTDGAEVLVTPERTAAALWLPPRAWHAGTRELVRTSPRLAAGLRGGVLRGLRLLSAVERYHPREEHWYLEALGAVPQARGTGVGGRVVQPMLDRCDTERLPAYLESSNPRNWSFYERLGFVRLAALPVPRGCPLILAMRREPR